MPERAVLPDRDLVVAAIEQQLLPYLEELEDSAGRTFAAVIRVVESANVHMVGYFRAEPPSGEVRAAFWPLFRPGRFRWTFEGHFGDVSFQLLGRGGIQDGELSWEPRGLSTPIGRNWQEPECRPHVEPSESPRLASAHAWSPTAPAVREALRRERAAAEREVLRQMLQDEGIAVVEDRLEIGRWLSKTGDLLALEPTLRLLNELMTGDQVLELFERLHEYDRDPDEWRDQFLALFPEFEPDLD